MADKEYNKVFADRFNKVLDKHGFPPRNQGRIQIIADMFLISHAGAGKWVNGLSIPSKAKLKDIANRFQVSHDWLAFGKGEMSLPRAPKSPTGVHKFPVLTFNEAPDYERLLPEFTGPILSLDIGNVSDETFVVYSIGTAMSGRFPEGTMLIVDPRAKPQDGDYVIATIAKLPEAIFRQLVLGDAGRYLYAHDPRYQTHKLNSGDRIVGKVVQARSQL